MAVKPGSPEYYHDSEGDVRWRVRDRNGEITEASSEGFANLRKAFDNYTITRSNVQVTYEEAKEQISARVHDHAPGQLADNDGSSGEGQEAHTDGAQEGAGGSAGVGAAQSSAADEGGDQAAAGTDRREE